MRTDDRVLYVRIPKELHRELKARAAMHGEALQVYATGLLVRAMSMAVEEPPARAGDVGQADR